MITIGNLATTVAALPAGLEFNPVRKDLGLTAYEHSVDGVPEQATKLVVSKRDAKSGPSTYLRLHIPVVRTVDDVAAVVGAEIIEITMNHSSRATSAERTAAVSLAIHALRNSQVVLTTEQLQAP